MIKLRSVPLEQLTLQIVKQIVQTRSMKIQQHQDELGIQASCVNCVNWQTVPELCGLFKQRPPATVIAMSCDQWKDADDIPF